MSTAFATERSRVGLARAKLLYEAHCMACHSEQIHWRGNKSVTDAKHLLVAVKHWQSALNLAWTEEDIEQVARYLNALYYHFKMPEIALQPPTGNLSTQVCAGCSANE